MLQIVSKYLHVVPLAKVLAYRTVGQMHLLWRWPTILGQASKSSVDSRCFKMFQDDSRSSSEKTNLTDYTLDFGSHWHTLVYHHHAPCDPLVEQLRFWLWEAKLTKSQHVCHCMPGHKGIKFCKLARSLACYPGILVQLQDVDSDSSACQNVLNNIETN